MNNTVVSPRKNDVVIYRNGEIELDISVDDETVWLTQKQLALLFDVEVHTINYHIKNIFKQQELDQLSTIRKIRIVQKEGKREPIITKPLSKQLKLDINKYNSQYENLKIKTSNTFHDRFLIIDDAELYHIGASLKDLGKRVFAFSKMDERLLEAIRSLK